MLSLHQFCLCEKLQKFAQDCYSQFAEIQGALFPPSVWWEPGSDLPRALCFDSYLRRSGEDHSLASSPGALHPHGLREYHFENKGFSIGIWGNIFFHNYPSLLSCCCDKLGREKFICFAQPNHRASLMEVRAGPQENLEADTEAEALKELCFLACSSCLLAWAPRTTSPDVASPTMGGFLYINH